MIELKRTLRKIWKKITKREFLYKTLIIVSSLALIATSVLPYILR